MKAIGLCQFPVLAGGSANTFGAYAVWVCTPNVHEFNGSTVGI
jgi:hypothetical protein